MAISNYAREQLTYRLIKNVDNIGSGYLAIGSGSGAMGVTITGLQHYFDRNIFTSVTSGTIQQISMLTDFNSAETSGLTIRQFGAFVESSGGKSWQVETTKAVTFTGSQDLQIELIWQIY